MVKILAIESSCDETAAAIIGDDYKVYSNVISTQIAIHRPYGGVVPEIASRKHLEAVVPTVEKSLKDANMTLDDVDAIAVTQGPGLIGSLLVGLTYGKTLAYAAKKPLIAVHHLQGHIHAAFIEHKELQYPFLALVVSGSHSGLVWAKSFEDYELLGQSRDDAAGEAFDKIARTLGLPYPGGPAIQEVAKNGKDIYDFPRASLKDSWDFSFSGLKSAVLNKINIAKMKGEEYNIADVACSAQNAIVDALATKAAEAVRELGVDTLVVAGGVAANLALREALVRECGENIKILYPSPVFCTDNAAMIGVVAQEKYKRGLFEDYSINAYSNLPFYQPFNKE